MNASGTYEDIFGHKFQGHILAVAARCPGFILRYRTAIDHEYFVDDSHRKIAEVLLAHVDEHRSLPTHPTLEEEVKQATSGDDREVAVASLGDLYRDDVSDAHAVMQQVIKFGRHQALVNATLTIAEEIDKGQHQDLDGYGDLRKPIDNALLVGEDLLNVGIRFKGNEDRYAYYTQTEADGERIPTGIPHLDFAMDGGLGRGELGVILAPPKKGKTTTLINFGFGALAAAFGYNVVHYSMEIAKEKVIARYDDRLMGKRVILKRDDPTTYVDLLRQRVEDTIVGNLYVQHYHTRTATVGTIRSHLSLLAAEDFQPDLIIVDYGDIMKPQRRLGEMRHEQAGIYEDLRQLGGEFDAAVWTASQTSKGALEKDVVTIADFAEAFEKAAIADAVWAFCQTDAERIEQKARLFAAALRSAEDGRTVEVDIRRDHCRIRSTGLFDPAFTPIHLPGEIDAAGNEVEQQQEERAPQVGRRRQATKDAIKEDAGISGKARRRPPAKKKVQIGKRPEPESEGKTRRRRRPNRRVDDEG